MPKYDLMTSKREATRKRASILMLFVLMFCLTSIVHSQTTSDVYVDDQGIMRWENTDQEVKGFGINYTVPFAHAYRMAEQLGISHEKAIDEDVYHFARLGLDLYRVHVWDTEISDSVGNLLENEHLRLFDYAIQKMKERGMKFIITPIAYWGNGWPEPDEATPGFSAKYGKGSSLTHPEAIKAQENYLFQFLEHVNPYTGLAYKDDPDVIAFEISNEPHHEGTTSAVTAFINKMAQSMCRTGTKKPVFYNMSHSVHLEKGYFDADIQGGIFQWYPTNLVAGHQLQGNFLPNVDKYTFPFTDSSRFSKMAKIVYEFDPADVGAFYIYPAMARSFRTAGMQLAAQFAYDAMYMAPYNTEYGTHYMNLPYAPQKALSLKIASEVFHEIPMYQDFGKYPGNSRFGDFRVDYEQDLAEMVSGKKFFYTNHTNSTTTSPKTLEEIAGYGNSPLVSYEGTGAYFLDKLENGVWRLEVMPDAIWVKDPFAKTSPHKTVSVINWRSWPMEIQLPDLGNEFVLEPLNEGNNHQIQVSTASFTIKPGAYLLTKQGLDTRWNANSQWKNIRLKEFVAPPTSLDKTYVLHQPLQEVSAGEPVKIAAEIITVEAPEAVELHLMGASGREKWTMKKSRSYTYEASIPHKLVGKGFLRYCITVKADSTFKTYPAGDTTYPEDWDFYDEKPYEVRVVDKEAAVYLFNAATDTDRLIKSWVKGAQLLPGRQAGVAEYTLNLEKIPAISPESNAGRKGSDYSMKFYFRDKAAGRWKDVASKKKLVFRGRSLKEENFPLQLALVMKDGSTFGGTIMLGAESKDYTLCLDSLKQVKLVSLPRPYPDFLPYYFENTSTDIFDLDAVESIQFSIGPGISKSQLDKKYSISIESVRLE